MSTATKDAPTKALTKADYDRPPADGVRGLQRLADPIMAQVKAALPAFMARNSERMIRCLMTECQRTPKLLDCSPKSLFGGVIQCAQLGIELGGPAGQAYLIPFKGAAQLVIGYKGFITLAHRSNKVRRFTPRVVRDGDTFEIVYGTDQRLVHRPRLDATGKPIGYYCVVELDNGGTDFEYLTLTQAEAHRDRYGLSKSGPWATNFDEMAQKTAIRKLAKRVPLSVEWVAAASLDELADEGLDQNLSAAVVLEGTTEETDELRERLEKAKKAGDEKTGAQHIPGVDEDPTATIRH
jgi:recombination protein RecT